MPDDAQDTEKSKIRFETTWKNMERENTLINYRTNWLISLSGGVIAAQSILSYKLTPSITKENVVIIFFMLILSIFALYVSSVARIGVKAAMDQIDYLKLYYNSHEEEFANLDLPRPFGDVQQHDAGHLAAKTFPLVMTYVWILSVFIEFGTILYFAYINAS